MRPPPGRLFAARPARTLPLDAWTTSAQGRRSPLRVADIGLFVVSALLVALAQALMIESLRLGAVGLVGPFKYTSLVWAVLLGFLVWGDLPDPWTWVGSALVVGSGLYIWRRELALAALRRSRVTRPRPV